MGDNNGEENERPAHLVTTLNYDYYIDKFEVTNRQYQEFCQTAGIKPPSEPYWDGSYSINQPDSPVVGVSWNDAKSYCEKVGKRLPTEAEWEKAASWDPRATDDSMRWKRSWPWGNSFDPALVNFASPRPTAASQFPAGISAYGVYQMAGNAGEWVEDVYQPYPGSQARAQEFDGLKRVVRGGTFKSESGQYLRTTMRFGQQPILSQQQLVKKSWLIGFRCAVRVDEPARQKRLKESNR
jgi:formylglycine-generating enzyme required for sulfatase activity